MGWKPRQSKIEKRFGRFLRKHFKGVVSQKRINGWVVDFYIKSIDTFVQLDGVYWHGLDRPLKEIRESKSKRDSMIYRAYYRDRRQDRWFKQRGKSLVRVTDQEFLKESPESILKRIRGD